MKEGISDLTTRRESRASVSNACTNTQDYLINTMKLRDRVLTARTPVHPNYRKTIRQLRSAPPFQNRNLDNYPMPFNREDAVKSSRGHRSEKRDKINRMTKERADSGLMREYSKQMFDFTVKTINNSYGCRNGNEKSNRGPSRTKSELEHTAAIRTNGPTPDGSILHNRKQKVLNSIRIRPHMEYETKFRQERTCSRLSLQHTISDKNRHYRVRSVSETIRPVSVVGNASIASSDFIFEPLDQGSEMNGLYRTDTLCSRRPTIDTPMSTYDETDSIEGVFGKDPFDDIDGRTSLVGGEFRKTNHVTRTPVSTLLPPDVACNLRLVSLDEESSSESEEEKQEPIPEVKKPEPPAPPKPTARGKKNNKITFVEEEKSKVPEPEPEPEPVKVKLILKGPHCWVDDATITSEQSEDENEDNPDGNGNTAALSPQPDGNTEKQNNQKVDNASKTKTLMKNVIATNVKTSNNATPKQPNQQSMKSAFEKALQNVQSKANGITNNNVNSAETLAKPQTVENDVVKKEDEDNCEEKEVNEIKLPTFICPSSERKSRQAALKEWLAHTCFDIGHRGVPVV